MISFKPIIFRYATTSEASHGGYNIAGLIHYSYILVCLVSVVIAELLKLIASFLLIAVEQGYSIIKAVQTVYDKIILRPFDTLQLAVPATLYFIANILVQKASANLPAAMFQVTYQGKTLVIALFSVILLKKQLTRFKWLAISLLAIGIASVEMSGAEERKQSQMANAEEQSVLNGLLYVFLGCFCSGFSGVYFEKMMKTGEEKPSMWVRNVQLAFFSLFIGMVPIMLEEVDFSRLLHGFNTKIWIMVCNNAFGGLCVAFVIKHADNILKGFAYALATLLGSFASVPLFGFELRLSFFVGLAFVLLASLMYGDVLMLSGEYWNTEPEICARTTHPDTKFESVKTSPDLEELEPLQSKN